MPDYPYPDGDVLVLGPEVFASEDEGWICWRGQNYFIVGQEQATEQIVSISEYEGQRQRPDDLDRVPVHEAGFQITTTEQVITLAIDDEASCCESWGYFLTEDDTDKFVGATLLGVKLTDTNRSTRTFGRDDVPGVDERLGDGGDVMFVDIETDRGPLQFVAYNAHNGYYGHEARVASKQLKHEVYL